MSSISSGHEPKQGVPYNEFDSQSVKWPKGTQNVRRTLSIIRTVSKHSGKGATLSQIARSLDIPIPTVKRILSTMVLEGFMTMSKESKRYYIGYDLYDMIKRAHQFHIHDIYHVALENLAKKTEDTVHLVMRSGFDAVCLDLVEGKRAVRIPYGIRSHMPLGLGCSGLVILAFLPDEEMEKVIAINTLRYAEYKINVKELRSQIQDIRKRGYNLRYESKFIEGIVAVGVPIVDHKKDEVSAAITVSSTNSRMTVNRCREIIELTQREIDALIG